MKPNVTHHISFHPSVELNLPCLIEASLKLQIKPNTKLNIHINRRIEEADEKKDSLIF